MIIDISDLENDKSMDIEIDEDFEEIPAHASGMLTVKSSGDFVLIRGNLQTEVELECSRCLKIYQDVLNVNIDEKFMKGAKTPITSKEHQMRKSDFIEELDGITEIDLNDLIYQNIIISIPSQTLCDENCEGFSELKNYIKADENVQTIEIPLKVKNNNNK
ncbi:MAG: DUF177 domain-containing protein [bacterium]|nr:DUF177 domain-containing protein [bacterium]